MILEAAAAISGMSPGRRSASAPGSARSLRSQSRRSPTVMCEIGANAAGSWPSMMSRVTSSVS